MSAEMVAEVVGRPLQPLFVLSQVNNWLRNQLSLFSLGVTHRTEIPSAPTRRGSFSLPRSAAGFRAWPSGTPPVAQ